jgi:hypothetical protein
MKIKILLTVLRAFVAVACLPGYTLCAEEILFIGNSFTYGAGDKAIEGHGGVPKLVEAIAASKGKIIATTMVVAGGKDWGFHLGQPKTAEALAARKWDWVVLQDLSTKPTHMGKLDEYLQNGETFYKRIREKSPNAKILLYETWARSKGSGFYTGKSTAKSFVDPAEMTTEIEKAYAECQRRLETLEPGEQVAMAPVGTAFARCVEKYPDMVLNAPDQHHASAKGSYLAALVIYATIFQDSPLGAIHEFPGVTLEANEAKQLQEIAEEVTAVRVKDHVRTSGQGSQLQ